MTEVQDGPRVYGATDAERRIVETLYRAISGEPDLPDTSRRARRPGPLAPCYVIAFQHGDATALPV